MSSNKKKKYPQTRLRIFIAILLKVMIVMLLLFACLMSSFAYWAWGGFVKSSLDVAYIPTAEYLLEHPIEAPLDDWLYSFRVQTNENYTTSEILCFDVMSMYTQDFSNLVWAEVYVNEQIVSRFHWNWPGWIGYTAPAHSIVCVDGRLENGLHIIEFRAKESAFSSPYYVRKWAIEIEN